MLLKEQKAKFSFLASDEEDEEDRKEERLRGLRGDGREGRGGSGEGAGAGQQKVGSEEGEVGDKEQRRKRERDREGHRGKKEGEGRKSPPVLTAAAASSSTFSTNVPLPEESDSQAVPPGSVAPTEDSPKASAVETLSVAAAHTPPFNGKTQVTRFLYLLKMWRFSFQHLLKVAAVFHIIEILSFF